MSAKLCDLKKKKSCVIFVVAVKNMTLNFEIIISRFNDDKDYPLNCLIFLVDVEFMTLDSEIYRGLRQGCPLSCLIFMVAVDNRTKQLME